MSHSPLQCIHPLYLQHTHGAGEVQIDSRHQIGHHNHGAQEKFISTVGDNLVQVAAQQHQPLLCLFLPTTGRVTTRTAAVVRRHERKKPDDKRLEIRPRRRTTPSDQHYHPSGAALQGTDQDLTGDMGHHGDSTRPSSRYGGEYFPRTFRKA